MSTSPMEELFWHQWQLWKNEFDPDGIDGIGELQREHSIGRYRVDFALPPIKLAIEIDGFDYHSSREQLVSDRRRQREIETQGWRVVRFAGSEIRQDAEGCLLTVLDIVRRTPATPEIIERRRQYEARLMVELGLTEADIDRS